jgi:hypothetical protein
MEVARADVDLFVDALPFEQGCAMNVLNPQEPPMNAGQIRAGNAAVEITGDNGKLKQATEQSKKELQQLGQEARKVAKEASRGTPPPDRGFLGNLAAQAKAVKKEAKASGELALEKSLRSGGSITDFALRSAGAGLAGVALELVGKNLAEGTKRAIELRKEFREGKISAGEMIEGIAAGVPVFGEWFQAGLNIHEILTGNKAAIDETNESAKRTAEIYDSQTASAKLFRRALQDVTGEIAKGRIEMAAFGKDGFTKQIATIKEQLVDVRKSDPRQMEDQIAAQHEADNKLTKALEEDAAKARAKLAATPFVTQEASGKLNYKPHEEALREAEEADRRLEDARKEAAGRTREITAQFQAKQLQDEKRAAQEIEQVQAERERQEEQLFMDSQTAINRVLAASQAERLKMRGHEYEATLAQIEGEKQAEFARIDKENAENKKRFGVVAGSQEENRFNDDAYRKRRVAEDSARQKQEQAAVAEFSRRRDEEATLQQLKIQTIQNAGDRELAEIDARYKAELDKARNSGRETSKIQARYDQERANKQRELDQQRADANRDIDISLAHAKNDLEQRGLKRRLGDLEIERKVALDRERNARTRTGVGEQKINELFDLQRQAELLRGVTTSGTFSAAEASRLGGTAPTIDRIAKASEETARNTRKIKQATFT